MNHQDGFASVLVSLQFIHLVDRKKVKATISQKNPKEVNRASENRPRLSTSVREGFVIVVIRWLLRINGLCFVTTSLETLDRDKLKESVIDQDESEIIRRLNLLCLEENCSNEVRTEFKNKIRNFVRRQELVE